MPQKAYSQVGRKRFWVHNMDKTGSAVEQEIFGLPLSHFDICNPPPYEPFKDALVNALACSMKCRYPYDPRTDLSRALYECVLRRMKCDGLKRSYESLGLFPVIGSSLDYYHGIDALFVLDKRWYVSIDVSLIDKNEYKANVLFNPRRFSSAWRMSEIAEEVARIFRDLKFSKPHNKPLLT